MTPHLVVMLLAATWRAMRWPSVVAATRTWPTRIPPVASAARPVKSSLADSILKEATEVHIAGDGVQVEICEMVPSDDCGRTQ